MFVDLLISIIGGLITAGIIALIKKLQTKRTVHPTKDNDSFCALLKIIGQD